ncbi:hypothetical protein GUITHDRAFT_121904 [Guillardia theta CCMP2712]|uniref:Uncharacterized protein n=1 Tax=Guillardia theta (strain CCMP2712) TaxID=905079 RepID=L1I7S1_GUITC|nr:hypothetical protein GUITHDRAFT_121904 [Guillardia theta CCMP2712]EKX31905.1 hypothetical protein GUITHDRAFT_121904 [Guillardia theta CCMP2712]|eukprot:XP_005818885.1 hypothetical protein GUITHDRAFT_121904 [Guillardia theta CCMP2712]
MLSQNELVLQQEIEERSKQLEEMQESFNEACGKLEHKEQELKVTKNELSETKTSLSETKNDLKETRGKLDDTTFVLETHKKTGEELYEQVEHQNKELATSHLVEIRDYVQSAFKELESFQDLQAKKFKALQKIVAQYVVEKNEEIEAIKKDVSSLQQTTVLSLEEQIRTTETTVETFKVSVDAVNLLAVEQNDEQATLIRQANSDASEATAKLGEDLSKTKSQISAWAEQTLTAIESEEHVVSDFVSSHHQKMSDVKTLINSSSQHHMQAIKKEQDALSALVQHQESSFKSMADTITSQVNRLVSEALQQYHQQMSRDVNNVVDGLKSSEKSIGEFQTSLTSSLDAVGQQTQAMGGSVSTMQKQMRDLTSRSCQQAEQEIVSHSNDLSSCMQSLREQEERYESICKTHQSSLSSKVTELVQEKEAHAAQVVDALNTDVQDVKSSVDGIISQLASSDQKSNSWGESFSSNVAQQGDELSRFYLSAKSRLEMIGSKELELVQDLPTGQTPMKKELRIPSSLPAFRSDDEVLAELRGFSLKEDADEVEEQEAQEQEEFPSVL